MSTTAGKDPRNDGAVQVAGTSGADRGNDVWVDLAFVLALTLVALVGFGNAYGGSAYLLIGMVGAVVGGAAAVALARFRASPVVWVLGGLGAFVVASGIAFPDDAIAGVVTSPASLGALISGLGSVWGDLATVAPPVGVGAGLGLVPYLSGFGAAFVGLAIARQTRLALVPAVPAFVVLGAGLLYGTITPVAIVGQGLGFVALALTWGAVRSNRPRRAVGSAVHGPRLAAGLAMVVVVLLVSIPVAGRLPFVDTDDRYVLREHTEPPFDPRNEPSPLASLRNYVTDDAADEPVLTVSGLPQGSGVRLATMDTYDGVVWIVGGPTAPSSGRFERVGSSIEPVPPGDQTVVTIRSKVDRKDVWLPTVGATESAEFEGDHAEQLQAAFRYNRDTGTGAVPVRLHDGDTVRLQVSVPATRDEDELADARIDPTVRLPTIATIHDGFTKIASDLTMTASTPYAQAVALESYFRDGYYSDGKDPSGKPNSAAGHSTARIEALVNPDNTMVGNAEQYAAAMALFARSVGLPARVVMGFHPGEDADLSGEVDLVGGDVDAWVEIPFEGAGWVAFHPTPDEDKTPEEKPKDKPQEQQLQKQEPPPPTYLEPPDVSPELASAPPEVGTSDDDDGLLGFSLPPFVLYGLVIVGTPTLLFAGVVGIIVGIKAWRMKRRRTRGTAIQRLDGAWREACDRAVDIGARFPRRSTRQEAAVAVDETWNGAGSVARQVDAVMWSELEPDDAAVEAVWGSVDAERKGMVATLDRKQKLKAATNLRSFRRTR